MMIDARELGPNDVFTSGMIALTNAVEHAELLMEHVYPADPTVLPLMKQTLKMGLEIKLERTHDLSAVIHAERLPDGRIMITAVPLLYGTYTVTHGPGTFRLEPPFILNLAAGFPLIKEQSRLRAELHYANYRRQTAGPTGGVPIPGVSANGTPPPAQNELVRIEPAKAVATPPPPAIAQAGGKNAKLAKATPTPKGGKLAKKQKGASPVPASPAPTVPAQVAVAAAPIAATPTPMAMAALASPSKPIPTAIPVISPAPTVAPAATAPAPTAQPASPAQPVPLESSETALASTAGGGTWKTFAAGKMPLGRLIGTSDLREMAERGLAGERIYLRGQFVVNFSDANRAVLRPRTKLTDKVLHFGAGGPNARIIVEFPAGSTPPGQGSVVTRDEARPYEITEIRKEQDGQLNVFAREIMQ